MSTKEIADWIKRVFDYDAVIVALVGSRAHGLATEDSDYDYIAFAEPTVEMIYRGEKVNEQFGIGEDIEVKLKDIRDLIPLLSAQNPNFLDIFLDKEPYVRGDYAWIFDRETVLFLITYDPVRLARSAVGMAFSYLRKPSYKSIANAMYLNNLAYYAITFGSFAGVYPFRSLQEPPRETYLGEIYKSNDIKQALNGTVYMEHPFTSSMDEYTVHVEGGLYLLREYIISESKRYPEPDYQYMDQLERKMMDTLFTSIF